MKIVVTVGSTQFDKLISIIDSDEFIMEAKKKGYDEIIAQIAVDNYPSWNICEKLGFIKRDNISKVEYMFLKDPVDAYNYFLTREMYINNHKTK